MKLICISDTHNKHEQIPSAYLENLDGSIDTIIHSGDVSGRGYKYEIIPFLKWYNDLPFKNKILIAGNHDFFFEQGDPKEIGDMLSEYPNITYLNDSGVVIDGLKFWGSPVQPWFYNWAFNRRGVDIKKHWDLIPLDTQILITHGPIEGYLDLTIDGVTTGCPYLKETVGLLTDLKLHICGHIHEAYGVVHLPDGQTLINASVLNHRYEMQNKPILIEL